MHSRVLDVSDWVVVADEPGGADDKWWLVPPGSAQSETRRDWWLFKTAKTGLVKAPGGLVVAEYRRNDDRVERIASQLARLLGVPAAEVELGRRDADEGCLSRYVIPDDWALASGDQLLSEFDGYVPCANNPKLRERAGHNLTNIQTLMQGRWGPPESDCADMSAFGTFAGYLVFDAWIANTDRHAVNWAMVYHGSELRLAASFDHGSALGSGLRDEVIPSDVPAWCRRGMAGRFEGGSTTTLVRLALDAVSMAGDEARIWLSRLAEIDPADWLDALRGVEGLSEPASTFMAKVLETNQRRLCS